MEKFEILGSGIIFIFVLGFGLYGMIMLYKKAHERWPGTTDLIGLLLIAIIVLLVIFTGNGHGGSYGDTIQYDTQY